MATAHEIRSQSEEQGGWSLEGSPVNVGQVERLASTLGGGILLLTGLGKGGLKGLVAAGLGGALLFRGATGHCHLYEAIGADTAHGDEPGVPPQAGVRVEEAVTIDRPADELFRFWRDYANLSTFMSNVESVTAKEDDKHSHWVVKGPFGSTLEYDAEIHNEEPGRMIAWQSLPGGDLDTAGSVHFTPAPGGRGTEVRVNQKFNPPMGKAGVAVAKLLGQGPESQTRENLRRLKMLMEAGEIATVEGQTSGRGRD